MSHKRDCVESCGLAESGHSTVGPADHAHQCTGAVSYQRVPRAHAHEHTHSEHLQTKRLAAWELCDITTHPQVPDL